MQNKMIRFISNLDPRAHIGNKELAKAGFLSVPDRVKQVKLGHVFKIRNGTSPYYMTAHFQKWNEIENRIVTRATAYNFYTPRVYNQGTNTFFYTSIRDWNDLPNNVKQIDNAKAFKEKLKQSLMASAKKLEDDPFMYY